MGGIVAFGPFVALAGVMLAIGSLGVAGAESPTPGGILESATSTEVRPRVAVTLPDRGRSPSPPRTGRRAFGSPMPPTAAAPAWTA